MKNDLKNIVIIDDEKYICSIITEALDEFKYLRVHKFIEPKKALDYISENSVDLVLTDLIMGDYSGVQILEHTLTNHPDTVVILMTGYPTVKTAISVLKKGGYDYLIKPFKLDDLKSTILRGLENQDIKRENVELRSQIELMKVAEAVSKGMRLPSLLSLIVDSAVRVLPATGASILLRDRKTGVFQLKSIAVSDESREVDKFLKGQTQKCREVIESCRPCIYNDETKVDGKTYQRSFVIYPLVSKGELIGIFKLVYLNRFACISPGQKRMVSLLVSNAALVVESNYLDMNLKKSYLQTIKALATAVEARDLYTAGHTDRVYRYVKILARKMGWKGSRLTELRIGAILHDIGKIGVPDAILNKPGKLSEAEMDIMMMHPEMGAKILSGIPFLESIIPYIISHHEKYNGTGYPRGLKGEDIPIEGRLLAVADTLDAMTSDRPYRKSLSIEVASDELNKFKGIQFDPIIIGLFNEAIKDGSFGDVKLPQVFRSKSKVLIP